MVLRDPLAYHPQVHIDHQGRQGMSGQAESHRIGPFVLDVTALRILHEGRDIEADAQQAALLICLTQQYPAIVDKQTLIASVWGGSYVTDAALQKTVSTLRKRLQRFEPDLEVIQTRHRRGYQLAITPVATTAPESAPTSADAWTDTTSPVLPKTWPRHGLWLGIGLLLVAALGWLLSTARDDIPTPTLTAEEPVIDLPPLMHGVWEAQSADDLLRIATAAERRDPDLARAAAQRLLERATNDSNAALQASAHRHLGLHALHMGQGEKAIAQLEQALSLTQELDDATLRAQLTHDLGSAWSRLSGGRQLQALDWAQQAVIQRRALDDPAALMESLNLLFDTQIRLGKIDEARQTWSQMRELAVSAGDGDLPVRVLIAQAALAYQTGDDAITPLQQALDEARRGGHTRFAAVAAQRLATQHSIRREHDQAAELLREARSHVRALGHVIDLGTLSYNEATLAERAGDYPRARALYQRALSETTALIPATMRVHAWLALDRIGTGDAAEQARQSGYREAVLLNEPIPLSYALSAQASAAIRTGHAVQARSLIEEAVSVSGDSRGFELDVHLRRLSIWAALVEGRLDEAQTSLTALEALFADREQGDTVGVAAHLRQALTAIRDDQADAMALFEDTHPGLVEARQSAADGDPVTSETPLGLRRYWPFAAVAVLLWLWLARPRRAEREHPASATKIT